MKEIKGYEGLYAINEEGCVFSLVSNMSRREGILKAYIHGKGYLRVNLYDREGKCKKHYVHRLVALMYLDPIQGKNQVNHKNTNKADNRLENLEWCSAKENIKHSRDMGLQKKDKPVRAENLISHEITDFNNLKEASIKLFGVYYLLRPYSKNKKLFYYKDYKFEVIDNEVHST